jgi:endonuclease/exonuclease/phosphatase family metal-dependent hydrolase
MTSFKVMTWNLENLYEPGTKYGPHTQAEYDEKLATLASLIRFLDPDVLAVQEVGSPVALQDLVNLLQGCYPALQLSAFPDGRGIRVGFLSKFPIDETEEIFDFSDEGLPQVPGLDSQGEFKEIKQLGRGALRIQISLRSDFPISLITAHLKSKLLTYPSPPARPRYSPKDENERARVAGIALLRRTAEAVTVRVKANALLEHNAQTALIMLGDLNDVPEAATTQILQGPTGSEIGTRGFNQPDKGDDTRMFNLAPLIPESRRYSRIHNGSKELIDHILVSQELLPGHPRRVPGVDSFVDDPLPSVTDDPVERRGKPGSDHSPVIATFEI